MSLLLTLCILSPNGASQALAEEAQTQVSEAAPDTPISRYKAETEALIESLSEEQAKKYYLIRNTHGIIRSVESVEAVVGKAAKSCKKNHKDLGKEIENRFVEWKLALHPIIKSSEDRLEKLVLIQDYAKPSDVKKHLKNFDLAATYGEKLMKQVPASDEESCTKLLKSMDATQSNLIRLLKETIGLE
tara:strand:+ start:233593 stop:234156 length:564 start_codon:yes stop_codon:yes gene_type:complete